MSVLARKISLAKWGAVDGIAANEVGADAVTADLRTTQNAISLWECADATTFELECTVVAIASNWERPDVLDLTWIQADRLADAGISLIPTRGNTVFLARAGKHVDTQPLDYVRLGAVATLVSESVRAARFERYSAGKVVALVARAVEENQVQIENLRDKMRVKVQAILR